MPTLVGATAGAIAYFAITYYAIEKEVRWLTEDGMLGWPLMAPAGSIALAVCIALITRAARYNKIVREPLIRAWRRQIICKRCSHIFLGPDGIGSDL